MLRMGPSLSHKGRGKVEAASVETLSPCGRGEGEGCFSAFQLFQIAIKLQRLRIGQRLGILDGAAMDDVADRELDDLATLGARYVGDLDDLRRDVARRRVGADL